ncbi:MAG: molybdopterin-dependent oxidoreductase [Planctomycetes bacterium]|nr:molybdopterin-dependent oxidoreductase [Planctomycetota bacterium]
MNQGSKSKRLRSYPPKDRWNDWRELDSKSWPERVERRYSLIPTGCFNCESSCGLLAYIDKDTGLIRKFEGNPEHPGSRGRNCAKGPASKNQVEDPDRILFPLRRVGARGAGEWQRTTWDEALDEIAARIRKAIQEERRQEIMYHVGRPGEDGYTERVLAAWGIDGHNSHTNICSSGARAGYAFWMGYDRPSPDHANAKVIFLVSAHLESGHYFNPHAQRIIEAKQNGAKVIVLDVRLSNTATHADHWLSPYPGSEPAIHLAIARHLIHEKLYDREFVRQWWNWSEYLASEHPSEPRDFETFERILAELYDGCTFEWAASESGVDAETLREVADIVASAGNQLSTHNWRSASSGVSHGWQVARTLFFLNALMGAVGVPGGTYPNSWNKFVAAPIHRPPHPDHWNELTWPQEFPLAFHELSFLLPHLVGEERGRVDTYFTRVYNPVWTNPDGFSWIDMLRDEKRIGCHVALTPTWNETAYFADFVLPMGLGNERHDIYSYETHDAQWIGFRQPVMRAYAEREGRKVSDTREVNPGEVWEENEFWIELSWRIDPDGSMGIRKWFESKKEPGTKLTVDEYYGWMFENSVPGLPERAASEGLTPLEFMRKYGAFEVERKVSTVYAETVQPAELDDVAEGQHGRVYTRAEKPHGANIVPIPSPPGDDEGRRPVGIRVDGEVKRGFPTPSGKLEFWSPILAGWGWGEMAIPGYPRSHVHPDNLEPGQIPLIPTFRLPVQIHTRSANSKWLDEIAHTNPLWIHPREARALGDLRTGDLVRVETEIGHFVVRAWVTEGIRPGVVACSHHMGRWKLEGQDGQRQLMATVELTSEGSRMRLRRMQGAHPWRSSDPDTERVFWSDVGVHQNLTFPVHPDPISGMHCWHQAVRVTRAKPDDHYGDISVDLAKSKAVFEKWLGDCRSARDVSPDGTRRPYTLLRPLKPTPAAYRLPDRS